MNKDDIIRCARDGDGRLTLTGPDGARVKLNVISVSPEEIRSFRRFRNATLARTWPPVIVTREEWLSIRDEFERNRERSS